MSLVATLLVTLSALFHATRNLFTKESSDKQVFLWWYSVIGALFFSPVFLYFVHREGLPAPRAVGWGLGSGAIHCLYWIFHTRAYETGDLSRVYPIMRSSPALVLLFAVCFLGEAVSAAGAAGILMVALGVWVINMRRLSAAELVAPFRSIVHDRATRFAFLTLLSVAAYSIVDKMAVERIHPMQFQFFHLAGGMLFYTPYLLAVKDRSAWSGVWRTHRGTIVANGFLGVFGYALILVAFTLENVSYVVGLRQLSIVFAVLMGGHFLKERHRAIRIAAGTVIFAGAFLISTAG